MVPSVAGCAVLVVAAPALPNRDGADDVVVVVVFVFVLVPKRFVAGFAAVLPKSDGALADDCGVELQNTNEYFIKTTCIK